MPAQRRITDIGMGAVRTALATRVGGIADGEIDEGPGIGHPGKRRVPAGGPIPLAGVLGELDVSHNTVPGRSAGGRRNHEKGRKDLYRQASKSPQAINLGSGFHRSLSKTQCPLPSPWSAAESGPGDVYILYEYIYRQMHPLT